MRTVHLVHRHSSFGTVVDSILRDGDDRATPEAEERGMVVEDNSGRLISFWLNWDDSAEPDL